MCETMKGVVRSSLLAGPVLFALLGSGMAAGEDKPEREAEPPCEQQCRTKAITYYRLCVRDGGDKAECLARAEAFHAACIQQCGEDDVSKEEDEGTTSGDDEGEASCIAACREKATDAYRTCLKEGADEGACLTRAERIFASCIDACE